MVIIPNYNKTSHNDCNQCNATEYWFMLYMSMPLILNIWLFKMIKSITFFRHADSRYFCSPSLVPRSLGALGSCPSRLPLDPPLRCVNPEWPRRRALDHSARMLKGVPSPVCWIHEWRGRPGRRRQLGPKRGPVLAAATCDNARWAGVWSSSLTTWPNNGHDVGDDILNTGKVGPVDNFCVSDKVVPAYPEDHT